MFPEMFLNYSLNLETSQTEGVRALGKY